MPPCAATVCERVGNTFVMQAVRRPGLAAADHGAQARAAGADHHDVVGMVLDRIGFAVGGRSTAVGGLAVTFSCHGLHSR